MKLILSSSLLVVVTAAFAAAAFENELTARVEMREGRPRIVVNGRPEPARMFWGRSNGRRTPVASAWTRHEWRITPHAAVAKGAFAFFTEEKPGAFEVRNLTVTAPDGTVRSPAVRPRAKTGLNLSTAPIPFAAETTYTVAFEARGEGVAWFRCGLEQLEEGVYRYHGQEVPWDDGERTSLVAEARQALAAGCRFVSFFTANCWVDGPDDWGPYDAQMRQLIALDPKVMLIPRVTANAPAWWLKKHPECAMVYEGGVTGTYASVSSRLYRKEACAYFRRLVRHLMETFPENFAGIHFSGQNTNEWFYQDSYSRLFGFDVCTRDAFREYLAGIGDPDAATAEVPTAEERHALKDDPEAFIDTAARKRHLDFKRFLQIEMADTVGELAAACREASGGKKLVLAFYGYHWELATYAMTPGNSGHYGVWRLVEKWGKNLDALAGPVSYAGRGAIGFAGVMSPAETLMRHGILWLDEDDLRVHAVDNRKAQACYGLTDDLDGDAKVMTRTVGMEAARGLGGWWMDLFGGGWYSDPGTWAIADRLHAFERRALDRPLRTAEVAAVCDEESMLNLERKRGCVETSRGCMSYGRTALAKAGVAFGQYVLEDALAKPLGAKVEFHLSTWKPLDLPALLGQVRAHPDVTRVWCWAPPAEATGFELKRLGAQVPAVKATAAGRAAGLDGDWRVESKKPMTPLYAAADAKGDEVWATWPDGSAAVAVRRNAGGKGYSVFCGIPCLTPRFVAAVCRLGGAHAYLTPDRVGKAVVWAGGGFVTVQAHEEASYAIDTGFADGVYDAFTGEKLSDGPVAELPFKAGETRVLGDRSFGGVATVRPRATDEALVNPDMGWCYYKYSNRLWAYGIKVPNEDTLDWFPGCSTVYLRVLWNDIEPEEGDFRWDLFDSIAQNWIAKGKKLAFRIICCNQTETATPEFVRQAGAKGYWFEYATDTAPGGKLPPRWEPKYDDPVFLEKLTNFIRAFAKRYDGDPSVAFVDVGSYGIYGECHHSNTSQQFLHKPENRAEFVRLAKIHLDLWRREMPNTYLVVSDDLDGGWNAAEDTDLMRYCREHGIGFRDDSIFCFPPPGTRKNCPFAYWAHDGWARKFAPTLPVVVETGHAPYLQGTPKWDEDAYVRCVEAYQCSYMSIHDFPDVHLEKSRAAIDRINRILGYRFELREAVFPREVKIGEKVEIASRWVNVGVAPKTKSATLCWSLLNADGSVAWSVTDDVFDFKALEPKLKGVEKPLRTVTPCRFGFDKRIPEPDNCVVWARNVGRRFPDTVRMLKPGAYTLAVSVGTAQGTPEIALPLENGKGRRYPVGTVRVVE